MTTTSLYCDYCGYNPVKGDFSGIICSKCDTYWCGQCCDACLPECGGCGVFACNECLNGNVKMCLECYTDTDIRTKVEAQRKTDTEAMIMEEQHKSEIADTLDKISKKMYSDHTFKQKMMDLIAQ